MMYDVKLRHVIGCMMLSYRLYDVKLRHVIHAFI